MPFSIFTFMPIRPSMYRNKLWHAWHYLLSLTVFAHHLPARTFPCMAQEGGDQDSQLYRLHTPHWATHFSFATGHLPTLLLHRYTARAHSTAHYRARTRTYARTVHLFLLQHVRALPSLYHALRALNTHRLHTTLPHTIHSSSLHCLFQAACVALTTGTTWTCFFIMVSGRLTAWIHALAGDSGLTKVSWFTNTARVPYCTSQTSFVPLAPLAFGWTTRHDATSVMTLDVLSLWRYTALRCCVRQRYHPPQQTAAYARTPLCCAHHRALCAPHTCLFLLPHALRTRATAHTPHLSPLLPAHTTHIHATLPHTPRACYTAHTHTHTTPHTHHGTRVIACTGGIASGTACPRCTPAILGCHGTTHILT